MDIRIIGTGSSLPKMSVSNHDLANMVETNDEWISSRTGIKERRIVTEETGLSMSADASMKAINKANIRPEDIDIIIVGTISSDVCIPSAACEVQDKIGAYNAVCFDLNAACSGFVFALNTAYSYLNAGIYNTALVIGVDVLSKLTDWTDRTTCVLFGDGAGAAIIQKINQTEVIDPSKGIMDFVMFSDGSKKDALYCKDRSILNPWIKNEQMTDYISMDGGEVFKFAVGKVPECISELLLRANVSKDDIKYFVLHQANERILSSVAKKLKVLEDRFPINLNKYGNTSAATIPILLDELNNDGKLQKGDKIVLCGFGGGLTWGATLVEW